MRPRSPISMPCSVAKAGTWTLSRWVAGEPRLGCAGPAELAGVIEEGRQLRTDRPAFAALEIRWFKPSAVSRRFSFAAGFYVVAVISRPS